MKVSGRCSCLCLKRFSQGVGSHRLFCPALNSIKSGIQYPPSRLPVTSFAVIFSCIPVKPTFYDQKQPGHIHKHRFYAAQSSLGDTLALTHRRPGHFDRGSRRGLSILFANRSAKYSGVNPRLFASFAKSLKVTSLIAFPSFPYEA